MVPTIIALDDMHPETYGLKDQLRTKISKIQKLRTLFVQMDQHLLYPKHRSYMNVKILNSLSSSAFNLDSFRNLKVIEINGSGIGVKVNKDFFKHVCLRWCLEFICPGAGIEILPQLPRCQKILCSRNIIRELPELLKVEEIDCSYNLIEHISTLPECKKFNCIHNKIIKIEALPECLELNCAVNQITEIVALPKCTSVICNNNLIKELPPLNASKYVICSSNYLTKLPMTPQDCSIECSYNLISDPTLPKQFINFDGTLKE